MGFNWHKFNADHKIIAPFIYDTLPEKVIGIGLGYCAGRVYQYIDLSLNPIKYAVKGATPEFSGTQACLCVALFSVLDHVAQKLLRCKTPAEIESEPSASQVSLLNPPPRRSLSREISKDTSREINKDSSETQLGGEGQLSFPPGREEDDDDDVIKKPVTPPPSFFSPIQEIYKKLIKHDLPDDDKAPRPIHRAVRLILTAGAAALLSQALLNVPGKAALLVITASFIAKTALLQLSSMHDERVYNWTSKTVPIKAGPSINQDGARSIRTPIPDRAGGSILVKGILKPFGGSTPTPPPQN